MMNQGRRLLVAATLLLIISCLVLLTEAVKKTKKCEVSDISVDQAQEGTTQRGIPNFAVQITNVGRSGSTISGIHVSCGWFSSASFINPLVFKRVKYNDCLVNNGKPLGYGKTLSFRYANTFNYTLSVSSVSSCP